VKINLKIVGLAVILAAGIYARSADLAWHFTHIDDLGPAKTILDAQREHRSPWLAVPASWTYAPFQFIFTSALLSPDLTYRQILYRGRLPSAAAGCLGLLALIAFYKKWRGDAGASLFALAILALSLENIIYAKQINNYALGVTAFILLACRLIHHVKKQDLSPGGLLKSAVLLGLLCSMHYQIIFFMPAFFLTLALYALSVRQTGKREMAAFAGAGILSAALVYPLWHFFLEVHMDAGLTGWNAGLQQEFLFHRGGHGGLFSFAAYAISFFLGNFLTVLRSHTSFAAEGSFWNTAVSGALIPALFVAGLIRLLASKEAPSRFTGIFFTFAAGTFLALVFLNKLTLSPTRHSLILLPLFAITAAEGLDGVTDFLRKMAPRLPSLALPGLLSLVMLTGFALSFGNFLRERRDPFSETEIAGVLRQEKADVLLRVHHTPQPEVMKSVEDYFGEYESGWEIHGIISNGTGSDGSVAWISHRDKLTPASFEDMRKQVNVFAYYSNPARLQQGKHPFPTLQTPWEGYQVVYSKEIDSPVEIDYGRRTQNGSNNFYFYVLKKRPA